MANKNSTKGFTLIEVLMSVTIMSAMAGVMILSHHSADQTPKREAEKVAAYITRLAQKSDRIKVSFDIEIQDARSLNVSWKEHGQNMESPFEVSAGLKYSSNFDSNTLTYDYKNFPNGAKISVQDNITGTHKYIGITSNNSQSYYVLVMAGDISQ